MHTWRFTMVVSGLAVVVGCSTAALSERGGRVEAALSPPIDQGWDPASCRSLGMVIGQGGGSFGGGWISNDSLVEYALNDLRNKAAQMGANYVHHQAPQFGVSGDKNGTTTSTATVTGTAYNCAQRRGGPPMAAQQPTGQPYQNQAYAPQPAPQAYAPQPVGQSSPPPAQPPVGQPAPGMAPAPQGPAPAPQPAR